MAEAYALLKPLHVALALLSGAGFALRGWWMLRASPRLGTRWVRVAPHVLDTALLATGVAMAVLLGLWPGEHPWLAAKLALLLVYIGAGVLALRRGRTRRIRGTALAVALAAYALIVVTAVSHRPLGVG